MDLLTTIGSRRTIHKYIDKKVEEKIIKEALMAANLAPCHRLTFPWRFTGIKNKTRIKMAKYFAKNKLSDSDYNNSELRNLHEKKFLEPSHLIIASQVLSKDERTRKEDYAACSCAINNICLYLASKEVGSKWSTGSLITDDFIYELADIEKHLEEIIGFIWIGYGKTPKGIKRLEINEFFKER